MAAMSDTLRCHPGCSNLGVRDFLRALNIIWLHAFGLFHQALRLQRQLQRYWVSTSNRMAQTKKFEMYIG
jgi:hypothetical protein